MNSPASSAASRTQTDAQRRDSDQQGLAQMAQTARETGFVQFVAGLRRTLATTPAGWLLVGWLCWGQVPQGQILLWLSIFVSTWALNLLILAYVARKGPAIGRHATSVLLVASLDGLAWGLVAALLMGYNPVLDAWLAAVLCGVGAVNAPVYSTYFRAYLFQIGSVLAGTTLALVSQWGHPQLQQGFVGISLFYALIAFYTHSISSRVLESIRLQLANALLTDQLRAALRLVQLDARTDPLTEQPNRRALDQLLQQQIDRAQASKVPFAVLMVDIDHFKQINDSHGHGIGDDALRAFVKRVRTCLRPGDICTRYGGEEFVVVLPGTTLQSAREVAERLRLGVSEAPLLSSPLLSITVSIGVAEHLPGHTAEHLLSIADAAVYAAKRGGRNQICGPADDSERTSPGDAARR